MATTPKSSQVTKLLHAARQGDGEAEGHLWKAIYDELHRLAEFAMAREGACRTIQPTALVHEVYVRLFGKDDLEWDSRRHFFGAAARAMRQILVDEARRRQSKKRGGDKRRESLDELAVMLERDPSLAMAVDEALVKLEREDPRKAEIVNLRFFAGRSEAETASLMGLSRRTIQSEWRFVKAWLHRELSDA